MQASIFNYRQKVGFVAGILVFIGFLIAPVPEGLSEAGWKTAAVGLLMAAWWISEALPISVTALLPIVLFPVLDIVSIEEATAPYANPLIFLFMGGFVIAIAMERWELHRRIALRIIDRVGTRPSSILIGFIASSAFLSMWVSNTATALMMLPIALSVLELVDRQKSDPAKKYNFEIVLVLCIAYACNIGGMGTIIGTPPNALLAGFINENYGVDVGFSQWMMIGIPFVLLALPMMYLILTRFIYPIEITELPGGRALINRQLQQLGSISVPEKRVAMIFTLTALFWIFRPLLEDFLPGLSDAGIAIGAAILFFLIPAGTADGELLLGWEHSSQLPWGVLLLFGGGLSLASAISETGLAGWIGEGMATLEAWPIVLLLLIIVSVIVMLTEMTSNTATAAAFLPILASVAVGIGENPFLLTIPAALAASCAFMLPVATPPNAIVYGSHKVTIQEMAKAGLWLNIAFILFVTLCGFTLISWVFGIELGIVPDWVG